MRLPSAREGEQMQRNSTMEQMADSANRPSARDSAKNYHFIFTPFIQHNYFFNDTLSGFEGGFMSAFSVKFAEYHSLGAHFAMSYGILDDKNNFNISNINLMLGLNYKLDLPLSTFLKARIDAFYFLNKIKTFTLLNALNPQNLGFGAAISYGKAWDFGEFGIFEISAGIDYKALNANTLEMHGVAFQAQLYNLLYADLAVNYDKDFATSTGVWGVNAGVGVKGNVTNNALAKSKVILSSKRSVNMILDNDRVLGYANLGVSYLLQKSKFEMEFSLFYAGNFGDKIMSNGGGFEWKTRW